MSDQDAIVFRVKLWEVESAGEQIRRVETCVNPPARPLMAHTRRYS